jgi:hypothetical protein
VEARDRTEAKVSKPNQTALRVVGQICFPIPECEFKGKETDSQIIPEALRIGFLWSTAVWILYRDSIRLQSIYPFGHDRQELEIGRKPNGKL